MGEKYDMKVGTKNLSDTRNTRGLTPVSSGIKMRGFGVTAISDIAAHGVVAGIYFTTHEP